MAYCHSHYNGANSNLITTLVLFLQYFLLPTLAECKRLQSVTRLCWMHTCPRTCVTSVSLSQSVSQSLQICGRKCVYVLTACSCRQLSTATASRQPCLNSFRSVAQIAAKLGCPHPPVTNPSPFTVEAGCCDPFVVCSFFSDDYFAE